eukprot:g44777.t1
MSTKRANKSAKAAKEAGAKAKKQKTSNRVKELDFGEQVSVVSLDLPQQRVYNKLPLPLALQAKDIKTLEQATTWVKSNQTLLEKTLTKYGAVLFRGFPCKDGKDFDAFVSAFAGWEVLPYDKSLSFAVRVVITDKVSTTNEGRAGGQIFHHEQAQTPLFPSKLFFFCVCPADKGGGTAITPSDVILEKLTKKYPEFVKKLKKHGVKYTSIMNKEQDKKIGAGRGWQSFFGRKTKEGAEEYMKELGYTWEWLEGERLKATTPVLSAIRVAPGTKKRVFFNQLIAQVANAKEFRKSSKQNGDDDDNPNAWLDQFLVFGDGSSMDADILEYVRNLSEEFAVEMEWQAGDICLLDNYQVMHARRAFDDPKRTVLASIFK